ncbi:hypothetical protein MKW98_009863 [Papaver atlanticum]|uniref:Uncharacterized protein n=1 Tax=Papaver atlanticum TaxID=357466 RepID=A0AAD4TA00_9MAGN|nr:hypothetical protein MKW98_009863 [Papaver atlanticum]
MESFMASSRPRLRKEEKTVNGCVAIAGDKGSMAEVLLVLGDGQDLLQLTVFSTNTYRFASVTTNFTNLSTIISLPSIIAEEKSAQEPLQAWFLGKVLLNLISRPKILWWIIVLVAGITLWIYVLSVKQIKQVRVYDQ